MGDKFNFLVGALEAPLGIAKRHSNIKLHIKERESNEDFNNWLYSRLLDGIPTAVVRFGGTEMKSLRKNEYNRIHKKNLSLQSECDKLCALSGFFPNKKELIPNFCKVYIELLQETDAIGVWDLPFERYFIKKYMNNPIQTELENLEPYNSTNPWSKALAGKKVLVIHPFAESIMQQYRNNREFLFDNPDVLPEFELKSLKAVQSLGGETQEDYKDWFEALDAMYMKALNIDFDVAIIGCGAYGMPLALKIKKMGKSAIHLGGATQMLFGIYGKRWEESKLINDKWIRPSIEERSSNYEKVEQGCYW